MHTISTKDFFVVVQLEMKLEQLEKIALRAHHLICFIFKKKTFHRLFK